MRVLLTNDDGILAAGLAALRSAVEDLGEVTVVAPDSPQSATGRAITLIDPIVCERVHVDGRFWGYGVSGRPADCVKLAVRELMPARPDLLLAGINPGANCGVNVFYSGTVAAAAEGAMMNIPSVAFSMATGEELDFRRAAALARSVLDVLLAAGLGPGDLINVNIPALSPDAPRGVRVVRQSTAGITESYQRQGGSGGRTVFRLREYYEHHPDRTDNDVTAVADGYIAVTPLHADLTDYRQCDRLAALHWPVP